MGNLIAYSALATKVRAMERWKLKESQFEEMAALETVPQAVEYLRKNPVYADIFSGLGDEELHRGNIERQLRLAQYRDFTKLYTFANMRQRRFLDMYFMHYELQILKTGLRNAAGRPGERQDLSGFREFFERHSKLDLVRLSQCRTMDQFISGLSGSPYYQPLAAMQQKGRVTLPDCENVLDMVYFKSVWRIKKHFLKGKERRIIEQCFGTRMDMLNLQWIYRSKKYYSLTPAQICALLIPIRLHLTKSQTARLAGAESIESFCGMLKDTWYGRTGELKLSQEPDLEQAAREINDRIYQMTSRAEPYSIAALNSHLYFKERELERITTTLERIRYGVSAG